jgi:hypothetical protein
VARKESLTRDFKNRVDSSSQQGRVMRRMTIRGSMITVAIMGLLFAGWANCLRQPEADRDLYWFITVLLMTCVSTLYAAFLIVNFAFKMDGRPASGPYLAIIGWRVSRTSGDVSRSVACP